MCIFSDILSMNESYISGLQTQIISCISIRFKGVVLKIGRYTREFTLVAKRGNLQTYMAHLSPETFLLHCYTFHTSDICDICLSSAAYVTCFTRAWWLHQMETFSALLALCAGRPVTRSFDVFFDLRLNKRSSKQSWGWWFQTPSRSSWRHCNDVWTFSYLKSYFTGISRGVTVEPSYNMIIVFFHDTHNMLWTLQMCQISICILRLVYLRNRYYREI